MDLPPTLHSFPTICGYEKEVAATTLRPRPPTSNLTLDNLTASFACALHMHQPIIPAGRNGELISNLQHMFDYPEGKDNHNASVFAWCYERMGTIIPQLVDEGCNPRIMLDYSGNLLWGLQQMGREDILSKLREVTCNPKYNNHVEWLGTMWSHAVVPSTPIPDLMLHMRAWQTHFASMFGLEALSRVKGFSPPEMHFPNHPDTLYQYIEALKHCGYEWLLVQEHSVTTLQGQPLPDSQKYVPNVLTATDSKGRTTTILAIIKTQGSDTKLVAQMQPYHQAKSMQRPMRIGNFEVPPLVTQIADGENGGVMMNEFPRDFPPMWQRMRDEGNMGTKGGSKGVVGVNVSEYLELIFGAGIVREDLPVCMAVGQHRIWDKLQGQTITPDSVEKAITEVKLADPNFHMEGASWTNNMSWVKGYEHVLGPMAKLSAKFHEKWDAKIRENDRDITRTREYVESLVYVLLMETSCFRYWGSGEWTDYAIEIARRGELVLEK